LKARESASASAYLHSPPASRSSFSTPVQLCKVGVGMPTPPPSKSKREEILDKGNARADRTMTDIGNLRAFDRGQLSKLLGRKEGRSELPFKVSREEFEIGAVINRILRVWNTIRPDCYIQRRQKSCPRIVVEVGYTAKPTARCYGSLNGS